MGTEGIESRARDLYSHAVIAHLLIYQLKNGKMALSFIHLDDPGGNEFSYYGEPWIAVEKNGKWEQVNKRHK
ncbi:MAG: hypothetical protein QOI96_2017 [Verrucomicrobiota bacterium]